MRKRGHRFGRGCQRQAQALRDHDHVAPPVCSQASARVSRCLYANASVSRSVCVGASQRRRVCLCACCVHHACRADYVCGRRLVVAPRSLYPCRRPKMEQTGIGKEDWKESERIRMMREIQNDARDQHTPSCFGAFIQQIACVSTHSGDRVTLHVFAGLWKRCKRE